MAKKSFYSQMESKSQAFWYAEPLLQLMYYQTDISKFGERYTGELILERQVFHS